MKIETKAVYVATLALGKPLARQEVRRSLPKLLSGRNRVVLR